MSLHGTLRLADGAQKGPLLGEDRTPPVSGQTDANEPSPTRLRSPGL